MIEILHRFTCDAEGCDRTADDASRPYYPMHGGTHEVHEVLADPHKPDGWTQIGAWVCCPDHWVSHEIDHRAVKAINLKGAAV